MKKNRSPGKDGLTKEFFDCFRDNLIDELGEMYNNIIFKKEMPESLRLAIITLLYKKNDHRLLKNWRPVSLLNVDYKILSKILTLRIKKIIHKILPINQKCGVPGRKMDEVLLSIDAIYNAIIEDNDAGAIIGIDQEKAFDRVSHEYLFRILEEIGFEGNYLTMLKAMYRDIKSEILINGKLSKKISITRSVRQGCSISMILFVISAIPLINMIEENTKIKGYKTRYNNEIKVLTYADDTTLIVRDTESIKEIFDIYNKYALASGAKINMEKTEILKLGKWRHKMPEETKYKQYIKEEIKLLGAYFHENPEQNKIINWIKKEEKVKKIIQYHTNREISLMGKVLLTNSLILSQYWHVGAILQPDRKYINRVLQIINKWINGNTGQYIIDKIMKPKQQGGAGLLNLENRLLAIKIKSREFLITGKWEVEMR